MLNLSSSPWPKHPLLYEINTRVWLAELSAKLKRPITLDRVPDEEIDTIAQRGFHAVWLMGVWTTGEAPHRQSLEHPDLQREYHHTLSDYKREDCIGSPYAISRYAVSPKLGGPPALAAFREKLAQRGMRLILDFVCNHTATDHWLIAEKPEVFVQGSEADLAREPSCFFRAPNGAIIAHGRDPYFAPWTDTAQINYAQSAGREAMLSKMFSLAEQCDGVRCDMAMLILPEILARTWGQRLGESPNLKSFWAESIPKVLADFPNFVFLAESYWNLEWQLQQEGFRFTYDKILYDRLVHGEHNSVRLHLKAEMAFQDRCARFIENHDEPRAATSFGSARSRSAAVVSFFTPGLKLLHEGQLEGWKVKLPVQLGRRPQEKEDVETALFYDKILAALRDPIFQEGTFWQPEIHSAGWGDSTHQGLVALYWAQPNGKATRNRLGYLVVTNLSDARAYGRVPLQSDGYNDGQQYVLHDHYEGKKYDRDGTELRWPGLYIALEPHQAHIFEISKK